MKRIKIKRQEGRERKESELRTHAKKPAQEHIGVNGQASAESELSQEKDAAADAADDLKKASLEDNA